MPVTEAVAGAERELVAYELAYHVLPTVAEGEVAAISAELKKFITDAAGVVTDEEGAERFELAYEIEKYLEGKYRRFSSAYFGWIRFELEASALATITEEVEAHKAILRSLVVRLTKTEEANPFRFHEALVDTKLRTVTADEEGEATEEVVEEGEAAAADAKTE